jgi:hypothetical protein
MHNLEAIAIDGSTRTLDQTVLQELQDELPGKIFLRGDKDYDEARTIWNGMFDKYPALVVRCKVVNDIVKAVNFARNQNMRRYLE